MKRITNIPLSADYQCQLIKNMKIPQLMILSFDFTFNRLNEVSSKLLDVLVESNPDFEVIIGNFIL